MPRLFVYGTLQLGCANNRILVAGGARFSGPALTVPTFTLRAYGHGGFPVMSRGGATSVMGEVFEINHKTLADCDRLEGHPRFYQRETIELADGSEALAYLQEETPRFPLIEDGNWKAWARTFRAAVIDDEEAL